MKKTEYTPRYPGGPLQHGQIAKMLGDDLREHGYDPSRYDNAIYLFADGWDGAADADVIIARWRERMAHLYR